MSRLDAGEMAQAFRRHLVRRGAIGLLDPPVQIEDVAAVVSASIELDVHLPTAGRVEACGHGRYRIVLDGRAPLSHQRFTLAHEIAHIILDRLGVSLRRQASTSAYEEICDQFARRLLIPSHFAASHSSQGAFTTAVTQASDSADVCPVLAFSCLAERGGWTAALASARWDRFDERWSGVAVTTTTGTAVRIVPDSWDPVPPPHRRGPCGVIPLVPTIEVEGSGRTIAGMSQVVIRGDNAWMVTDLEGTCRALTADGYSMSKR